jgi:hypothetical protein
MNDHLRDRIQRKLDTLSDERAYQVLDYIEFLESKYAERQSATAFTRFADAVEDKLRAGRVSASTIAETVGLMNKAANVLNGALQATKAAASEFVGTTGAPGAGGGTPAREASSPARDTREPGTGQEKL